MESPKSGSDSDVSSHSSSSEETREKKAFEDSVIIKASLVDHGEELQVEAFLPGKSLIWKKEFKEEYWRPSKVFQALQNKKFTVHWAEGELVILVFNGAVNLRLPILPTEGLEIKSLKSQLKMLEARLNDSKAPIVLSQTTTVALDADTVVWNKEFIPIDTKYFGITEDMKSILIFEQGIYRFDVQLLGVNGQSLSPHLVLNNSGTMTFQSSGYGLPNLHYILYVPANCEIQIKTNEGDELHVNNSGNNHYFCIQKLSH